MTDPAGTVESELIARLADEFTGLNVSHSALIVQGASYEGLDAINFDFGDDSSTFNRGRVGVGDLIGTSEISFPYMMLEVRAGQNFQGGRQIKSLNYSGGVTAEIEAVFSWEAEQVTDFSTIPNSFIAAAVASLNNPDGSYWGGGVLYNANMAFQKSPVAKGAENWFRSVLITLQFEFVAEPY